VTATGRLVIMGSGETAPTMIKMHRTLLEGVPEGAAVLLDTPYGFQRTPRTSLRERGSTSVPAWATT
jgi:hypothetical protein